MWISQYDLQAKLAVSRSEGMNEVYASISKENQENINKIEQCAFLLGYDAKKIKVKRSGMRINGNKIDQGWGSMAAQEWIDWEADESRKDFIDRLIAEDKEKKRLIALAQEVEQGKKLMREYK